jgi:hypothetical protein
MHYILSVTMKNHWGAVRVYHAGSVYGMNREQMKEMSREADRRQAETDKAIRELSKNIGGLRWSSPLVRRPWLGAAHIPWRGPLPYPKHGPPIHNSRDQRKIRVHGELRLIGKAKPMYSGLRGIGR